MNVTPFKSLKSNKALQMKRILASFIVTLVLNNLFASPQLPDYIIYKNDTLPTYNLLVEKYLQSRVDEEGRLFGLSFRTLIEGELGASLNCWRGYQAIYKIENDSIFVTAILPCYSFWDKSTNRTNYIKEIFGDKVKNNKVFIDWFTGTISFPVKSADNKMLRWDGVFEKIFLYETLVKIKKGKIIDIRNITNYVDLENGIDRMKRDSMSNRLFEWIKQYKWKKLDKYDCSEAYTIEVGKNGKISNVVMTDYQTEDLIEEYWDSKKEYNFCIRSIKRALSKLQFDIIKRKGKPIKENVYIEIFINEDGTIENWTE